MLRPLTSTEAVEEPPRPSGSRLALAIVLGFVVAGGAAAAVIYTLWPEATPVPGDVEISSESTLPPKDTNDRAALDPHLAELGMCTAKHRTTHAAATASMAIGPDGRMQGKISFTPVDLEGTPLGNCLSAVFASIQFEPRAAQSLFAIDIALPRPKR